MRTDIRCLALIAGLSLFLVGCSDAYYQPAPQYVPPAYDDYESGGNANQGASPAPPAASSGVIHAPGAEPRWIRRYRVPPVNPIFIDDPHIETLREQRRQIRRERRAAARDAERRRQRAGRHEGNGKRAERRRERRLERRRQQQVDIPRRERTPISGSRPRVPSVAPIVVDDSHVETLHEQRRHIRRERRAGIRDGERPRHRAGRNDSNNPRAERRREKRAERRRRRHDDDY